MRIAELRHMIRAARGGRHHSGLRFHVSQDTRNLKETHESCREPEAFFPQPHYPASDLYRLVGKDSGLQLDFMSVLHGVKSFESLKSRASSRRKMKRKSAKPRSRKAALAALKKESESADREQIRLLLSLPMNKRTHFLRIRLPNGGSSL